MPELSAAELTALRAVQTGTLPDTCTIQRATLAANTIGEQVETWATVTANVACRLANATTAEGDYGSRVAVVGQFILTVPNGTDLAESDRVLYGASVFQVAGVLHGSWTTCLRAAVVEVT